MRQAHRSEPPSLFEGLVALVGLIVAAAIVAGVLYLGLVFLLTLGAEIEAVLP